MVNFRRFHKNTGQFSQLSKYRRKLSFYSKYRNYRRTCHAWISCLESNFQEEREVARGRCGCTNRNTSSIHPLYLRDLMLQKHNEILKHSVQKLSEPCHQFLQKDKADTCFLWPISLVIHDLKKHTFPDLDTRVKMNWGAKMILWNCHMLLDGFSIKIQFTRYCHATWKLWHHFESTAEPTELAKLVKYTKVWLSLPLTIHFVYHSCICLRGRNGYRKKN